MPSEEVQFVQARLVHCIMIDQDCGKCIITGNRDMRFFSYADALWVTNLINPAIVRTVYGICVFLSDASYNRKKTKASRQRCPPHSQQMNKCNVAWTMKISSTPRERVRGRVPRSPFFTCGYLSASHASTIIYEELVY